MGLHFATLWTSISKAIGLRIATHLIKIWQIAEDCKSLAVQSLNSA